MYLNGLCFITDRRACPISIYDSVKIVLQSGVRFVQYREKNRTRREIYEEALRLRDLTLQYGATFIVNDYPDIALSVEADGVHLGQDDLPLEIARRIMKNRIIGISTHDLKQAQEAENGGADYIGYGPIFHTTTKDAGIPKGVDSLRVIKQNVNIPVIAIGGIKLSVLNDVFNAGADAVAVATAICNGDIEANTKAFIETINKIKKLQGEL